MSIQDFINKARAIAPGFCGNPSAFFAQLKSSNPVGTDFLEREYQRFCAGTSKNEKLQDIFEAISQKALAAAMTHVEGLASKAEAALLAKQATAAAYLQSVGREVVQLATHPDTKISAPLQKGLSKSLVAAERLMTASEFAAQNTGPSMTPAEFELLPHSLRGKFFKSGGRLSEDKEQIQPPAANAKTMSLAQFNSIPHSDRKAFFARGGKLSQ